MNVLLIGSGAREHVIAETLKKNDKVKLYGFLSAKNPGIVELCEQHVIGKLEDFASLKDFISKVKIDFAIVGPEAPLEAGVADFLETLKIPCVGPKKELAKLETSKSFTRNLMEKYGIPGNPRFEVFKDPERIMEFMQTLDAVVIKPDGLTAGKGVKVQGDHFQTRQEAFDYCVEVLKKHPAVIVEEKLEGEEFSLQSFCDGKTVVDMPVAQDHKRAFDDDKGPNTGGMGSYSDANHLLPFLSKKDVDDAHHINQMVCDALLKETGIAYKGIMYGGFIVTKKGVKLIEYNCRFGDPEAMNVLPILRTDFVSVCLAIVNGKLGKVEFSNKATVCKYAVPKGYPDKPVKDVKIDLSQVDYSANRYYASVEKRDGGLFLLGSRAVAFVGVADTLARAEAIAEAAVESVKGPVAYRKDIGTSALISKRVAHMKAL